MHGDGLVIARADVLVVVGGGVYVQLTTVATTAATTADYPATTR